MTINELIKQVPKDFHDCEIVIDNADYNYNRKIHSAQIDQMGKREPRVILIPGNEDRRD